MTFLHFALLVLPSVALLEVRPLFFKRLSNNKRIAQRRRQVSCSSIATNGGDIVDSSSAFASLGLSPELAVACAQQGYARPTAVQQGAVAPLLAGHDLWAAAPTGSGKTVAYAAPLLQRCLEPSAVAQRAAAGRGSGPTVLVLVPTRELALQVGRVFASLADSLPSSLTADGGMAELEPLVLVGGSGRDAQARNLQRSRAAVIVATPGRLLDLVESGNSGYWSGVQAVVLDEADRLLSPAFRREVDACLLLAGYDQAVVVEGHSGGDSSSSTYTNNFVQDGNDNTRGYRDEIRSNGDGGSGDGSTSETSESMHQGPQTVLVSATFPAAARARAKALLRPKAVIVDVRPKSSSSKSSSLSSSVSSSSESKSYSFDDDNGINDALLSTEADPSIDHRAIEVAAPRKLHLLLALLKHEGWPQSPPRSDVDSHESCDDDDDDDNGGIDREESEGGDLRAVRKDERIVSGGSQAAAQSEDLVHKDRDDDDDSNTNKNDNAALSLESMPASDLKALLRSKGLKTSGSRSKLMKRLAEANAGPTGRLGSDNGGMGTAESALTEDLAPSIQTITPRPKRHRPRRLAWGPLPAPEDADEAVAAEDWSRLLVFVASQKEAERIAAALCKANVGGAVALHGGLGQAQRQAALQALDSKEVRVLVATDLASRGLDVPGLPAVVNFDLPRSSATYLHRVGRVGRAGKRGVAVSFVRSSSSTPSSSPGSSRNAYSGKAPSPPQQEPGDVAHLALIERRHNVKLRWQQVAAFMPNPPSSSATLASPNTNGIDRTPAEVAQAPHVAASTTAGSTSPSSLSPSAAVSNNSADVNAEMQRLTVPELKAMLRERGFPVGGRKADLLQRLEMAPPSSSTEAAERAPAGPPLQRGPPTAAEPPRKEVQGLEDELLAGFDSR